MSKRKLCRDQRRESIEPHYIPLRMKMESTALPDIIKDLIRIRHVNQRNEIGQTSGAIELGFYRGYQAGYEDRVMGKPPEHLALTTRKKIRTRDTE